MPAWSGEGSAVAIAPVRDALRTTSCVTRCGAWRAPFTGGPCRAWGAEDFFPSVLEGAGTDL